MLKFPLCQTLTAFSQQISTCSNICILHILFIDLLKNLPIPMFRALIMNKMFTCLRNVNQAGVLHVSNSD